MKGSEFGLMIPVCVVAAGHVLMDRRGAGMRERQRHSFMKGAEIRLMIPVCVVTAGHVLMDRRGAGMRERHQRAMAEAHESEYHREDEAERREAVSVRTHAKHLPMFPAACHMPAH